jgi:two-component system CheB/CheR fusion protein
MKKAKAAKRSQAKVPAPEAGEAQSFEWFPIVGVGASAGGLEAFSDLLRHLPEKNGMALVLVQHLDPTHGSVLQEILARTTKLPVTEVTDGMEVKPDHVYVMPANKQMVIQGKMLRLAERALVRGQHMPINEFFASLAEDRGAAAIGVILSGTASDGTKGCEAIKAAGGTTLAQDEKTAKYRSMPQNAIHAGCIDFEMSPAEIVLKLVQLAKEPMRTIRSGEPAAVATKQQMDELYGLMRDATGVDFQHYKQTTLQRRIRRRMDLEKIEKLGDYVRFVRDNPAELNELYKDVLIHVTEFFRDRESFEQLRKQVFPELFSKRIVEEGPVRVWVPGCSTGEEVYSIAIYLLEYLWEHADGIPVMSMATKEVQIFATDISESALDHARAGLYKETALAGVSPERLKVFFTRMSGGYQISKPIREMCIFAKQNLAKDPPFSNLDLISCRNLLIYLGPSLQNRVIPAMHYALKPNGFLILGGSETLGTFSDHFTLIDKKYKIYQKKKNAARLITYFTGTDFSVRQKDAARASKSQEAVFTVGQEVERLLAKRFLPPSIVLNEQMEIVQIYGHTGEYLEPAAGHPTFSLSKMAREGLLVDLQSVVSRAKKENVSVKKEGVTVESNGGRREVDLEVIPLRLQATNEQLFLVVFREPTLRARAAKKKEDRKGKAGLRGSPMAREYERLNRELRQSKESLQSLIEEHETTLEEFKSSSEEVLSTNEELQSANEEMETAKEELQSSNEELTTLNEELQNRNVELMAANNDLLNLLANANIPIVMVGSDMKIRRFTPPAQKLLNLIPSDVGRRLGELRPNFEVEDLEHLVHETVESSTMHEREVQDASGAWHLMRTRPYKTWENKIDGAVLSFQDIDTLKRSLEQTRMFADALFQNARESILLLDEELRVASANPAFCRTFETSAEDVKGRVLHELGNGNWNIAELRWQLTEVVEKNTRIDHLDLRVNLPQSGERLMLLDARRLQPLERTLLLISIEDVTEKRRLADAMRRQAAMLEMAHDAVIGRELEGKILFWNHSAEEMYGWKREEALGRHKVELLTTQFPVPWKEIEAELQRDGHWEGELVHRRRNGSVLIVQSRWALQSESGAQIVLEFNTDVTDRRRSEEQFRDLLESAPDAMVIVDESGRIVLINAQTEKLFQYKREELLGQTVEVLVPGPVQARHPDHRAAYFRNAHVRPMGMGLALYGKRKDGSEFPVEISLGPLQTKEGMLVSSAIRDVTDRKRTEEKLRKLSGYLIRVQDEERRRIARDLHDSTGQKLILLKMTLGSLDKQLIGAAQEIPALADCMKLADEATQEIRTMAQILHPPLLEEAGLGVALRWLAEGFANRSGIEVDLQVPEELERMPADVEIALFRVVQEALSNVHRHSKASRVEISVQNSVDTARLRVADNGKGIAGALKQGELAEDSPTVGVGIQGMRERLAQLDGSLEIKSGKKGTTIRVTVPLKGGKAAN